MTNSDTFGDLLTPENLSNLMRSTWTWDDRALRRQLATVLVDLTAARAAAAGDAREHAETLRARALVSGADFLAEVLGPHLIADAGSPRRSDYLAGALGGAGFARDAASAFDRVRACADVYAARQANIDYPAQPAWISLITSAGSEGLAAAMRACGYKLSQSDCFANAGLAWQALRATADTPNDVARYIKAIEAGEITATLAVAEQSGSWDPALLRTKAVHTQRDWRLSGFKTFVPGADTADIYFVIARSTAGPSLFAVERHAPGLQLQPLDVVDKAEHLSRIEFAETPGKLCSVDGAGGRLMMNVIDLATTALAAQQVGVIENAMSRLLAAGLPGSELAEVTIDHMAAVSLWRRALDGQVAGSEESSPLAAAAHVGCSRAALRATTLAARCIGPSDETDAAFRRALSTSLLFGGPAMSHERLLERLGL